MKSIQTKLIALILGCVVLSSAIIGGAGISKSRQVVDGDSAQIMNLMCSERAKELDALLARIEQSVKTLADYTLEQLESVERLKSDPAYLDAYATSLLPVTINSASNTEGAVAVYVRFNPEFTDPTSGLFWSRSETDGPFEPLTPTDLSDYLSSDVERVGWYHIPVEHKKPIWIEPYYNRNIHVQMISYVIPLYQNDETVGVVGMDIDFGVIEKSIRDTTLYESGYAFLANETGQILWHKALAMGTPMASVNASLIPVVAELEKGTSDKTLFEYTFGNENKKMAFRTLRNGMRLVVTAPVAEIDQEKNDLIFEVLTALFLISAFTVAMTVLFTRRLIRPLKELNEAAQKIAAGDFSVSIGHHAHDEVGTLADSFQKTAAHLQQHISYINGLAYRDALTGTKNKTAYQEAVQQLEMQIQTGRPEFALVVLDINGLKQINDSYGHDFGDLLIMNACKLICNTFKRSPVYRIGGDEFVVILQGADLAQYRELLTVFEAGMGEHNRNTRPDTQLFIAHGVAVYDSDTDLIFANVFKRADEAMYRNKAAIKSFVAKAKS